MGRRVDSGSHVINLARVGVSGFIPVRVVSLGRE